MAKADADSPSLAGRNRRRPPDQPPPRSIRTPRRQPPQQKTQLGGVSWRWEEKGGRGWAIPGYPLFSDQGRPESQVAKSLTLGFRFQLCDLGQVTLPVCASASSSVSWDSSCTHLAGLFGELNGAAQPIPSTQ